MTTRREQVREAIARHRKRRKRGFFWRSILVTKAQLDQLEERGYLNPSDRGTRADECEAIARPNRPNPAGQLSAVWIIFCGRMATAPCC